MFKSFVKIAFVLLLMIAVINNTPVFAQANADSLRPKIPGFIDADKDGVNDVFVDANGDGKNDVDDKPYAHKFKFLDENEDGLNDLWQDRDGDGVNDLYPEQLKKKGIKARLPWIDKDGDGLIDPDVKPKFDVDLREFALDEDGDGKNDITGCEITEDNLMGYRYGNIDEENDKVITKFEDENGDGMHDQFEKRLDQDLKQAARGQGNDYFIDRDGDGIADDRGFGQLKNQARQRNRGKRGNR